VNYQGKWIEQDRARGETWDSVCCEHKEQSLLAQIPRTADPDKISLALLMLSESKDLWLI